MLSASGNRKTHLTLSQNSSSSSTPNPSCSCHSKTMEEVWKDINLASLNDQDTRRPITTTSTFGAGGVILQDFLARPFNINDPPNSLVSSASASASATDNYGGTPSPAPPPPVTALSLSSRPQQFQYHKQGSSAVFVHPNDNVHSHYYSSSRVSCFGGTPPNFTFDNVTCSSSLPCFGSKRFAQPSDLSSNLGDRRNKRMIKNRESAARSRARKQAYTNELQLKVDHLLEENARLRRQQQQLCEAAANQQKRKSSLYRTSTAPF